MKLIRILGLALILLLTVSNIALADSVPAYQVKEVDGYKIGFAFEGNYAQMGHNKVHILINDAKGNPVTNSQVTIAAELYQAGGSGSSSSGSGMNMDMGNNSPAAANETLMRTEKFDMMAMPDPGMYEGEINLDEAGHWMIKVNSVINQQVKTVEFAQEISKGGPNVMVLAAFIGVIAVVIAVVFITKRRSVKAVSAEAK